MKVKDLIEELKCCDPEAEATISGMPIWMIQQLPGYYDGHYEKLILDKNGWDKGMEFTREGTKVVMRPCKISDLVWNECSFKTATQLIWKFDSSLNNHSKVRILKEIYKSLSNLKKWEEDSATNK